MPDEKRLLEFFFSGGTAEADPDDSKLVWKDVLREGHFAMTPGLGGNRRKGFTVIADGESDSEKRIISMSDLIRAHEDNAFEHVTIPTRHEDQLLDNTGFVPKLRRVKKQIGDKAVNVLQAGLGFTEPDVAGKVKRGTIPNVSGGIFFNFTRKADGKKFRAALKHVCLTHTPWINKLDPFPAILASDDELDENIEVEGYQFADSPTDPGPDKPGDIGQEGQQAEIVWDETTGYRYLRDQIQAMLNPNPNDATGADNTDMSAPDGGPLSSDIPTASYFVNDINDHEAVCTEMLPSGAETKFIVPYSKDDNGDVVIAPATRWVQAKEAMIAASDDPFSRLSASTLRDKLTEALSHALGPHAQGYKVDDVSLDRRARIVSTVDKAAYEAEFAVTGDGSVHLIPVTSWKQVETPKEEESEPVAASDKADSNVIHLSDTPEGRLLAARTRRRQVLSR